MEKPIVNMTDWQLNICYFNVYYLEGVGDWHPKLGKYVYIHHTSRVLNYSVKQDDLICETKNTIYVCPFKYMTVQPYMHMDKIILNKLLCLADYPKNDLDKIISAGAAIALEETKDNEIAQYMKELQKTGQVEEIKEKERFCDVVKKYENSVYFELSHNSIYNFLAYHVGDNLGVLKPQGLFRPIEEMNLYIKEDERIEFWYCLKGDIVEKCIGSENIESVVITNNREYAVKYNNKIIEPGETRSLSLPKEEI